ncbi:MAG: exodeoxyribonuclease VII large subunit [Planctomycetota bacterium]
MSERLTFDPTRVHPPAETPLPATLTVRQVTELVRGALNRHLPPTLHVIGELGNFSRPASGHIYFSLKDADSELPCVMWRSAAVKLKFEPEIGMEVLATGNIDVYAPRGLYQLYVRKLEPRGVGALEIAFRQLKERLERAGLFDPARKRPIPAIPQRVALVTSPSGAAIRDIIHTMARRFPAAEILLFPVRVQGEGAAEEIAAAIRLMNVHAQALGGIDVAIVGRGGGSLEDLWAFNEEVVARAIAASRIPIVSAVGHEVDVSISDLVADLRAPTPTAAAELITPEADKLREKLTAGTNRAGRALRHGLELARARLGTTLACEALARPLAGLRDRRQLVDELQQKLRLAANEHFQQTRSHLDQAALSLRHFGTGAQFQRIGEELARRLLHLHRLLGQPVSRGERHLRGTLDRLRHVAPERRLARHDEHLAQTRMRLKLATRHTLHAARRDLAARLDELMAYDPRRVLERGYSITRDARTRRIIRSIEEIRDGQLLQTELPDGEFKSSAQDPHQPRLFD